MTSSSLIAFAVVTLLSLHSALCAVNMGIGGYGERSITFPSMSDSTTDQYVIKECVKDVEKVSDFTFLFTLDAVLTTTKFAYTTIAYRRNEDGDLVSKRLENCSGKSPAFTTAPVTITKDCNLSAEDKDLDGKEIEYNYVEVIVRNEDENSIMLKIDIETKTEASATGAICMYIKEDCKCIHGCATDAYLGSSTVPAGASSDAIAITICDPEVYDIAITGYTLTGQTKSSAALISGVVSGDYNPVIFEMTEPTDEKTCEKKDGIDVKVAGKNLTVKFTNKGTEQVIIHYDLAMTCTLKKPEEPLNFCVNASVDSCKITWHDDADALPEGVLVGPRCHQSLPLNKCIDGGSFAYYMSVETRDDLRNLTIERVIYNTLVIDGLCPGDYCACPETDEDLKKTKVDKYVLDFNTTDCNVVSPDGQVLKFNSSAFAVSASLFLALSAALVF